jgi:hypothetical protein
MTELFIENYRTAVVHVQIQANALVPGKFHVRSYFSLEVCTAGISSLVDVRRSQHKWRDTKNHLYCTLSKFRPRFDQLVERTAPATKYLLLTFLNPKPYSHYYH